MATVRELLDIARGELGYKETPANSNRTKYGAWYGLDGQPWCVMFVEWVFAQASVKLPIETASCTILMNAAKSAGNWVTSNYQPGDVVIYDWGGDKRPDHCGIVEAVGSAYISTAYRDAFSFIILFIVLFVKPTGLLNKKIENKL